MQGWRLLRKAGLSREQKQLIMTQTPIFECTRIQEVMFLILGQDYKHVADHSNRFQCGGRGRSAYYGENDTTYNYVEAYEIAESYWQEIEYDEMVLCEYDRDIDNFDQDAAYYNGDEEIAGNPVVKVKVFDEAYAAYLDARKRFNGIMLVRSYLPIVALANFHSNLIFGLSCILSSSLPGSSGKGKGSKGKGFKRK